MKKNILHHLIWALVAITTFVVGSKMNSSNPEQSAESKRGLQNSSSSRRVATSAENNSNPRAKTTRFKTKSRSGTKENSILTAEGIAELGAIFKNGNLVERRLAFAEMLKELTADNARQLREQIAHMSQD
ncbi:MAG: hypothetical protein ACPGQF_05460, partial [Akkermansiaceae bacterium]